MLWNVLIAKDSSAIYFNTYITKLYKIYINLEIYNTELLN